MENQMSDIQKINLYYSLLCMYVLKLVDTILNIALKLFSDNEFRFKLIKVGSL